MTSMVLGDFNTRVRNIKCECTFIYHITQVMQIPNPADKDPESHNGQGHAHSIA
jgi:hypothetical protein